MQHLRILLAALLLAVAPASVLRAAVPLFNPRITGDNAQVASGTFTVQSGATATVASGGTFSTASGATVSFGDPLSLANGGIGVVLTDPNADRIAFWDDSAGSFAWLTVGSGLTITGTTLAADAGVGFANPMTTEGDIITGATSGTAQRVAVGTEGQILTVVSGVPAWDDAPTSGFSNPMTTAEDIIVGGTSGAAERLAVGTEGQVLKVVSGVVAWSTDSTGSGSLPGSPTEGDLTYYDGADWVSLGIGTAGQVLATNGAADAPEWATPSSGGTATMIQWGALGNQPPASNYATFDTRNSIAVLDYDASTAEAAVFVGIIPDGADLSSGIRVRLVWMATSATSGDVVWTSAFERGNTDLDADSFASGISATTATNATSGIATTTVIDHAAGEIDGLAAGELFRLRLTRDADNGSDTMTGDAELIALEIQTR